MGTLLFELRCAARALVRSPGFTAAALLTFALGIGANTAVFSFVQAILLRPLPFAQPERLVVLYETHREKDRGMRTVAPRNLEDWRRMSRTIEEFGAWRDWRFTLKTDEGSEGVPAGIASPALFRALRVEAAVGRVFRSEEDDQVYQGHPSVVLSYNYWVTRFARDPGVVGKKILVNNYPMTIVGVSAAGFAGLDPAQSPQVTYEGTRSSATWPAAAWVKVRVSRWLMSPPDDGADALARSRPLNRPEMRARSPLPAGRKEPVSDGKRAPRSCSRRIVW